MKNFYEDNSEQKDIEDISSGRFDFDNMGAEFLGKNDEPAPAKPQKPPHIPGVQPTVRFKNQSVQPQRSAVQQPTAPQAQQSVYGQYPPVYYYPGSVQPVQGMPVAQPYDQQVYPYYQQPVYGQPMPQQYVQYGQPVQSVPYAPPVQPNSGNGYYAPAVQYQSAAQPPSGNSDTSDANQPNPGTRVLYQSEDFERPEIKDNDGGYYSGNTITHEDVVIEEESVPVSKPKKPRVESNVKRPSPSFTEDELEIGNFELNAIALKHNSRATVIKHKAAQRFPETSDVNVSEYEEYFITPQEEQEQTVPDKKTKNKKSKKKVSSGEIVRRIILAVSVIAIIVAGAMLLKEYKLSKENDEVMQDVEDMIIDVTSAVDTETTSSDETTKKNNNKNTTNKKPVETTVLTEEQQWDKIKAEYPDVVFPMGLQLKYAKLYAENQDFVGYLSADGVGLNLPVVQAQDDEEYLNKNFYGNKTKYGCPFVTHVNNINPLDMNTVIFGHHMNNKTIFGTLDEYKTIEGFKKAPVITFNTLNKDYKWKVIAAFITNAEKQDDNGYIFKYYFTTLSTTERYASYLSELSQRSLYDTGIDVLPTDKILTLSTCSHEFENARFVVVARLVRPGESTDVDVSKASVNDNPRYPQAFYDKKNKENPYADAYRWEVG